MLLNEDDGAEIKRLRDELQIGVYEAKQIVIKSKALDIIDSATTIEEIKPILKLLIESVSIQ